MNRAFCRPLWLFLLIFIALPMMSQPARVAFLGSQVMDSGGTNPLSLGQICALTTDANDRPMGYRVGSSGGQTSASVDHAACGNVVNGSFAPFALINSAASSPQNACIRVYVVDGNQTEIRRNKCVQTGTAAALSTWCSAGSDGSVVCNWDQYPIGTTPQPIQQVGPPGPQGPAGCPSCRSLVADVDYVTPLSSLNASLLSVGMAPLSVLPSSAASIWTDRFGGSLSSSGYATPTAAVTFVPLIASSRAGRVTRVRITATAGGTLRLKTLQDNGDGTFLVFAAASVTLAAGKNDLVAGRDFDTLPMPSGGYLGYTDTGGHIAFANGGTQQYARVEGDLDPGSAGAASPQGNANIALQWDVESNAQTAILEHWSSFLTAPTGWAAGSNPTYSNGAVTMTTQQSIFGTGYLYGIDRRTLTWAFQMGSTSTIAGPATVPSEQSVHWGSYVRVNAQTNALEIMSAYYGGNAPYVLQTTTVPWTLAANHTYLLQWRKTGTFSYAVRLSDPSSGQSVSASRSGYMTYANINASSSPTTDQGGMQGAPQWFNQAGSSVVLSYDQHSDASPSPTLYALGDSITEGLGLRNDADRWCVRLRATLGSNQVVCSGVSGATAQGALPRLQAELAYLRPRHILIFLGTNSEPNFASSIQTLVAAAQASGAEVGVATVPASAANTATVNALKDVRIVHFDRALTASGAGSPAIPGLYTGTDLAGNPFNDSTHPNAAGNLALAQQVLLDWPELAY